MKGGIQKGTTASTAESLKIDKQVRTISRKIFEENDDLFSSISFCFSKEEKQRHVGDDCFGFAPDGGAWFLDDHLVLVLEAKKQGKGGNAQERWFDNAVTAKFINPDVHYVTFCVGEGAQEAEVFGKLKRKAKLMMGNRFRFHLSKDGFTDWDVEEIIRNAVETILKENDDDNSK